MSFSREAWTTIHGLVLGVLFLIAFVWTLIGLWKLRSGSKALGAIRGQMTQLYVGAWTMAVVAWGAVITGSWVVYPWYRAQLAPLGDDPYAGCAGATVPTGTCSPRDFLKSNVSGDTEWWHAFGMEWKEHISWAAPILATAVAFLIYYYGPRLRGRPWLRAAVFAMFVSAFGAAAIGGVFGGFLNSIAPIT
ncbi:MAG TPA: hypothetical protein VF148_15040 [Acidimicrobiia bacterium]